MKILISMMALTSVLISGCAHNIQITPTTNGLNPSPNKIEKSVGYHISETDRNLKVQTPGGGGDDITYTPYKDMETAFYAVLSHKFKDVYKVKSLNDNSFIKENEIKLIFIPTISTNSSSSSLFTWPPTHFTVDLSVKALNDAGQIVWSDSVKTNGVAEFDEFKNDFGLAAKRATESAILQLAEKLEKSNSF
ncbi:hypothetical protein [Paraglaciecola aestuariivivens]